MKTIILFFFAVVFSACNFGCSAELIAYDYKGFDSNGVLVIKGVLNLEASKTNQVFGNWKFQLADTNVSDKIRNTIGSGKLVGTISEKKISLDLNPGGSDNNVTLNGEITTTNIFGTWGHSGFAGFTVGGKFEAVKNN